MNEHKREPAESPEALRRRAEQQLDLETLSGNDLSEVDAAAVIHELRVHQIELQTQNQELREAQHELERSRTQYAELFDFAPNGYLVFDANGVVVQANLTAAAMLGWERSILLGRPFSLYVAPAGRDTWRSHYSTVFKTGKSQQCELELVGRGETRLTVRLVSRPVIEAGDQVVQCRTAMLDVTALVRAEQRAQDSERRFRTLAENSPDVIVRIDRDLRIVYTNPQIAGPLDRPAEEVIGRTLGELEAPAELVAAWTEAVRRVVQTARIESLEFQCDQPGGLHYYSVALSPEFGEDQMVQTVLVTIRDISGRVQAEEKYTTVIRSLQDGFCIFDAAGRYLEVNDACCRMLDRTREELLGMSVFEVWDAPQQEELTRHLQQALEEGSDRFTMGHCRKDGGRVECDITLQRLNGDRIFAFSRDVTAPRAAEGQRLQTLRRLELVAQATNDGIWDVDLTTERVWHNEAFLVAFGYAPDEGGVSRQWWEQHIHPNDRPAVVAALDQVLQGDQDRWSARYRFQRGDGSFAWVMSRARVLRDEQGRAVRLVGSMTDLTEKLEILDQLEAERAKLATILDTALSAIIVVDKQGSISYVNPAAQQLHGQPLPLGEDLEGHRRMGLYHLDGTPYEPGDLPLVRSAVHGETHHEEELLVQRPDGEMRQVLLNTSPLMDREGNITGAVAIIQDVTAHRQAEQKLREAHDKLEEMVRARTAQLDATVATLQEEVAERIEAQDQLVRQNEILQKIINNIPVLLCFFDPEGHVGLINHNFTEVLGYSLEDFREHRLADLCFGPEVRGEAWEHLLIPEPTWRDMPAQAKDGSQVVSSWVTVQLADGSYVGIGVDLRERARNIRKLQQQARLLDLAHDSIVVHDMDGRIVFWNRGAEQAYGWTQKEAVGRISHELLQTRFPLNLFEITARLLSESRWNGELTHTTRDGRTIIVSTRWALQRDEDGRPSSILVIDRDITQQKRAEQATIEARRFAESIINTVQEALLVLDGDLRVISANETFFRTFEVSRDQTEGRLIYELGNGQWDLPELRRLLEDILPNKTSFGNYEVEHDFERIGPRTMLLNARQIYRQSQETRMILLAIVDISVAKEQQRKIEQHQHELAALTEELLLTEERERRRLALLLHDSIGQSLAFSKREIGVLQRDAPPEIRAGLDSVKQQIDDSVRQTRELTFELSPTTLYTFGLEAAVEELAEQFAQRDGFRLDFEASDEDKPLSEQTQALLYRASRELLTNISKHAGAAHVSIHIDRTDGQIRMVVADDGKGFDSARLEDIIHQQQGFGLLSIRERLTHVGGTFTMDSRVGQGTKVTLVAPLHQGSQH